MGGSSRKRGVLRELREGRETLGEVVQRLTAARRSLEQMRDYASAQRDLVRAWRQFSDLYDFLPLAYLLLDSRGRVRRVNDSGLRLFGLPRQAVVGRPLVSLFARECGRSLSRMLLQPPDEAPANRSLEARVSTANASPRVRVMWRRVADDGGEAQFHVALIDLTETQELQQAERLAREANESKDQFLATLSHELRTPLTPILSAVDSLRHVLVPGDVAGMLEVIRRNVRAEARLIDDLLDVARITQKKLQLKREMIDLHEVLSTVAEDWRPALEKAGIALRLDLRASRHFVAGDADRLEQVCRNLLGNAAKFTDGGGSISLRSRDEGDRLAVIVEDTGIGMPPGVRHVFEPFVQVAGDAGRRTGLGLGLVICRGIVEAHEGRIRAASEGPGRGTAVTFELPTIEAPTVEVRAPHRPQPSDPAPDARTPLDGRRRVLLLEDHPDSAHMLSLLLQAEGYTVIVARSKREGLSRLADCDLVVSDIGLPDGSGLEFMAEARRRRPLAGVALSGFGSQQDVQRSLDAGFTEHLTKPVDFDRLLGALRRLAPIP